VVPEVNPTVNTRDELRRTAYRHGVHVGAASAVAALRDDDMYSNYVLDRFNHGDPVTKRIHDARYDLAEYLEWYEARLGRVLP